MKMIMSNKILIAIIIALTVILGIVLYWQKIGFEKPYYAVYLDTGDLYFGKISRFPKFSIYDVYYLSRDDSQNQLGVSKFSDAFWGPGEKIYINGDRIVWKVKLKKDSQFLTAIKGGAPLINRQEIENRQNQSQQQKENADVKQQ